jgi:acyl carrier protein
MEIQEFVSKFASILEETDPSEITASTKFSEIEEWSSLLALCLLAMIDEEYNIAIAGEDIRNSESVEDIFNIVKSKI